MVKKIKLFFLVTWVYLKRYYAQIFLSRKTILTFAGVIFAVAFILNFKLFFISPGQVSQGMVGIYSSSNLPQSVSGLISEPLVVIDKTGHPQPNLLVGWQTNNDATLYTFRLRDDIYWSDGEKLKSSQIKLSYIKLDRAKVTFPDDNTIAIQLEEPLTTLPSLLNSPIFKNETLIGVGRYKVTDQQNTNGVITRLSLTPVSRSSKLPNITVRFYTDEKTAKTAYALGEVDSLIGVIEDNEYKNSTSSNVKHVQQYNKLIAIFYNTKDPLLSDKNLRKALNSGAGLPPNEDRAITSINPNYWAFNDTIKDSVGSESLAKDYLSKVENLKGTSITLTTTPALANLGEKIIGDWKKLGITAVLRVESGVPQNFQALLFSQNLPSDPDQYLLWHSAQNLTNLSKYSSARVDRDLEDGRKNNDSEQRRVRYHDFQKVLNDDTPATFLYFQKTDIIYRKRVEKNLEKILPLQFPG